MLRSFLIEPLEQAEQERATGVSKSAIVVLLSAPFLLTLREYALVGGDGWEWLARLQAHTPAWCAPLWSLLTAAENRRLTELGFWALVQVVSYLVLPALIVKFVLRARLSDYGLKLRGAWRYWWVYLGMYLVMLPVVLAISTTAEFQATYPFYQPAPGEPLWPRFCLWQVAYAMQFVSLEFFFRGYLIHGTKRALGAYCILVMTIPYCMIHYGKPLPEVLGSIGAGVVLGFMSLKLQSIWLGAALHIAVAVTMDLAALWQEAR
jgi:membrane protease YdiL (CAAX protease family)